MSQDPKRSKRLELDATDEDFGGLKSAYLETPFGEDTHIGKIMDFSSRGLRVHFDLPPDSFPHAGGILHNAVLGTTSTREELSRLIIRRVEQTDEGHVELGLEGEDEETRSSIWRTMHELENIVT